MLLSVTFFNIRCWGNNANGQIGVGTNTNVLTPTKISQLGAVSTVVAGSYHTCAITMFEEASGINAREDDEDGRKQGNVYCFGYNSFGQLGIGNLEDQQFPQKVDLGGFAKDIKAGRHHTCALMEDDTVKVRCSELIAEKSQPIFLLELSCSDRNPRSPFPDCIVLG